MRFEGMGRERLLERMEHREHAGVEEVVDAQHLLALVDALIGERRGVGLLVDPVVARLFDALRGLARAALLERGDQAIRDRVDLGVLLRGAGDDERRARLVDQDRVDLVDDRVMELALDAGAKENFMLSRR